MFRRFRTSQLYTRTWDFALRHERHIPLVALVLGFIWDSFTLGRPDRIFDNAVLLAYLAISAGGIILLNLKERRGLPHPLLLLGLIQFSFGNLAGGLLVLYGKSGTVAGSALFFALLLAFIIGNEFSRSRYAQLSFNVSVWYFLTLLYMTLITPVLLDRLDQTTFLLGGAGSAILVAMLLAVISAVAPRTLLSRFREVVISVALIFGTFNALYFANFIPPVPLSLKNIGVYHSLARVNGNYSGTYEGRPWFVFWRDTSAVFHESVSNEAYCFSSVFAPSGLKTPIYHRWEYYDESAGEWITTFRIAFPIVGGRETGYRGYSLKRDIYPGRWRCNVETGRGSLVGRISFTVVPDSFSGKLLTGTF